MSLEVHVSLPCAELLTAQDMDIVEVPSDDCYGSDSESSPESDCDAANRSPVEEVGKRLHNRRAYGAGVSYWDARYIEAPEPFEWVEDAIDVQDILFAALGKALSDENILHVGCGNSRLPVQLFDRGIVNIVNIDNSPVVIEQMRHINVCRPSMQWLCMDARQMTFTIAEFDIVIDKSALDSMTCMDDCVPLIEEYLCEVGRVLRPGGVFVCISFAAPPARLWCFDSLEAKGFSRRVLRLSRSDKDEKPHYVYVLTKDAACTP